MSSIHGSLAWSGADGNVPNSIVTLDEADNLQIKKGLQIWQGDGKNGSASSISKETFPLTDHICARLEQVAHTLHSGSGFAVVRGLETQGLTPEDNMIIYLGLCSYIGTQRGAQNKKRDMITHITDAKDWSKVPHEQRHGIHTNSALPFHTDMGCETLALHYRAVAQNGGATSVVSATTIYNELAAEHPDDLRALMAPDWPVQLTGTPATFGRLPLLAVHDGRVVVSVDPGRLGLHPATAGVRGDGRGGDPSPAHLRALSTLSGLAEKHAVSVEARPGDILFINNLGLLHKRDAYTDAGSGSPRHLVRLWLRNPELSWDIPENMKAPWTAAYGKRQGFGRFLQPAEDRYQIVPEKEYKVPKYSSGSAAWLIDVDEA